MKKKTIIAATLLLLFAAGGLLLSRRKQGKEREPRVKAIEVVRGPIEETVDATGSISPLNRVEVKPPISGRMEKLLADEGDVVRAGRVLAWMSSSDRAAILDAARAQGPEALKKWEDDYKPTPIVAPLSGVVILKNVVAGQTVDPGVVLYAMSDSLIVLAQVDESDIGRVRVGMPARVVLDAYPDKPAEGAVFDILYEGKNVSNVITYGVKVRTADTPAFFRSQMTANVHFILNGKADAVLIPAGAVQERPNGVKTVSVPGPGGKPEQREITTGIESGEKVEVLSGLSPGDQVLLTRGKYVPQQGPQNSPLTMGGRPSGGSNGRAPRSRGGS